MDASKVVGQEKLMLDTHSVTIPPAHQRDPGLIPRQRGMTATAVLRLMTPTLLDNHVLWKMFGDGNSLYRALVQNKEIPHTVAPLPCP